MNRPDNKHQALLDFLGWFEGETPDMELLWLKSKLGVAADNLPDCWHEYMDSLLITDGPINDRWVEWLTGLGHLQDNLPEQFNAFWQVPL